MIRQLVNLATRGDQEMLLLTASVSHSRIASELERGGLARKETPSVPAPSAPTSSFKPFGSLRCFFQTLEGGANRSLRTSERAASPIYASTIFSRSGEVGIKKQLDEFFRLSRNETEMFSISLFLSIFSQNKFL